MTTWTSFTKTRLTSCCTFDHLRRFRAPDSELSAFFSFILAIWFTTRSERECKRVKSSGNLFWGKRVIMTPSRKTYTNRLLSFWCWNMSNIRLVPIRIVSVPIRCLKSSTKHRNHKIFKNLSLHKLDEQNYKIEIKNCLYLNGTKLF